MNFELFNQGPATYIPVLFASIAITALSYGTFPFLLAHFRKKHITKKKYTLLCYTVNLIVMSIFIVINGKSSGGPYILWSMIFTAAGLKILEKRGMLSNQNAAIQKNDVKTHSPAHNSVVSTSNSDGSSKKIYTSPKKTVNVYNILIVLMCTCIIVCAAIAVYQNYSLRKQINNLELEITQLTDTISTQKAKITEHEKTITSQKSTISDAKKKADIYDDICIELSSGNIGYAASNFNSDQSVIIIRKNEQNRKVTLTANWSDGGNVYTSYSSDAAYLVFDNDSWYTSTTLTVVPQHVGATTVTFTNDVNSDRFKILIIVID